MLASGPLWTRHCPRLAWIVAKAPFDGETPTERVDYSKDFESENCSYVMFRNGCCKKGTPSVVDSTKLGYAKRGMKKLTFLAYWRIGWSLFLNLRLFDFRQVSRQSSLTGSRYRPVYSSIENLCLQAWLLHREASFRGYWIGILFAVHLLEEFGKAGIFTVFIRDLTEKVFTLFDDVVFY